MTTSHVTTKELLRQDSPFLRPVDSSGQLADSLPCLYSNNDTETEKQPDDSASENLLNLLSPYHRKAAHVLFENVASLIDSVGLDCLGFLTLTFPDNITDPKEAYSRFKSLNSHFFLGHPQFGIWLCVKERQKRGAWHYHILIDCGVDIRTGVNWDEIGKGVYRSAGDHLRGLWSELRVNLPKYGFGRSELLPIRKNGEAMGRYVGKYIAKHIEGRKEEDKGVRLVSYSKNWPRSNAKFQWHTPNSHMWRFCVRALAEYFGCDNMDDLKKRFGPRWAYYFAESIIAGVWPVLLAERKAAQGSSEFPFPEEEDDMEDRIESVPVDERTKELWKSCWRYQNPHLFSQPSLAED